MYNVEENIIALATPPGRAALSVVRCSGSDLKKIYKKLTKSSRYPKPNHAHLKTVWYQNTSIDQMMITFFRGPKSFTGEDVLEFSMHGGPLTTQKFITLMCSLGFRQALPGEFSYRSFINGKINLMQAEAINELINTNQNLNYFYSLNSVRGGGLSKTIKELLLKLKNLITYIEHELDFSENEIEFISINKHIDSAEKIYKKTLNSLHCSFQETANNELHIILLGNTNVGKSSIFNCLLGYNKSITTSAEGTTRDCVEARLSIGGLDVLLVDTAGIRETKEKIEKIGINKTFDAIKQANIVLVVDDLDPNIALQKYKKHLNNKKIIKIQNKVDINIKKKNKNIVHVSATKKTGIKKLFTKISTLVKDEYSSLKNQNMFLINERQRSLLQKSCDHLLAATGAAKETQDLVIFVSYLQKAKEELSSMLGNNNKDEIINNIFKGFCVGK